MIGILIEHCRGFRTARILHTTVTSAFCTLQSKIVCVIPCPYDNTTTDPLRYKILRHTASLAYKTSLPHSTTPPSHRPPSTYPPSISEKTPGVQAGRIQGRVRNHSKMSRTHFGFREAPHTPWPN
jgi:hypothetical protein